MRKNKTGLITTYAKHTRGRVDGFQFWDQEKKEDCPLYNPTPLGNTEVKHNDGYAQDLKELIEKNKRNIIKDIREIVNINLSVQIVNRLYDTFMSSQAYSYKAVTKYNIPYAMLYYQQSISLYGQYVGFSEDTLKNARKFYLTYKERISETVFSLFEKEPPFVVSWSHYLQLMRIENEAERSFYEIETAKSGWGVRTLQRQYSSSLYERLALSKDKEGVMRLAKEGNVITKPEDIVKQPTVLEFLGLEEKSKYSETDLETALINKLQKFLLELGKGYLFEARQKRFSYDEDNYYVDLVFYNRLLRCYVLIDLKVDKLTHQDIGQMQIPSDTSFKRLNEF